MECADIRERLQAYLDDALGTEERGRLEEHLAQCESCAGELEEFRVAIQLAGALDEVEPPPWMTRRIMEKVRGEGQPSRSIVERLFRPLRVKLPIEAFAVVLLGVATYYVFKAVAPEVTPVGPQQEAPKVERSSPLPQGGAKGEGVPSSGRRPKKDASGAPASAVNRKSGAPTAKDSGVAPAETGRSLFAESQESGRAGSELSQAPAPAPPTAGFSRSDAEGVAGRRQFRAKAESEDLQAQAARPAPPGPEDLRIAVTVTDVDAALGEVRAAVTKLGGRVIRTEGRGSRIVAVAAIDGSGLLPLRDRLRALGEVKEPAAFAARAGQEQEVRIELMRRPGL